MEAMSVVVPLFNGQATICETLDSLHAQSVPLHEIIVVDDGSTDDGPRLVRAHACGARLITQENAGVAVARNRGAFSASSRRIAFLDQDDLWAPTRHERLLAFMQQHDDVPPVMVTTERSFVIEADVPALVAMREGLHPDALRVTGSALDVIRSATANLPPTRRVRDITTRDLLAATVTVTTSYVVDREAFFACGGCAPNASTADDYWMLLNASRLAPLWQLDEPTLYYRVHPASTTQRTTWSRQLLTLAAAARHGGALVPAGKARDTDFAPPLDGFVDHWLDSLAREGLRGLVDAVALTRLLSTDRGAKSVRRYARLARAALRGARARP